MTHCRLEQQQQLHVLDRTGLGAGLTATWYLQGPTARGLQLYRAQSGARSQGGGASSGISLDCARVMLLRTVTGVNLYPIIRSRSAVITVVTLSRWNWLQPIYQQ